MRFITEFQLLEDDIKQGGEWPKYLINQQEQNRQFDMGCMLANSFGWESPVNGNNLHHRLEIEAFPMDKWIEFKKRFADALPDYDSVSRTRLINAIADLESSSKPDHYEQSK